MTRDNFSSLFDLLPIGAYRTSPEGKQLRANQALGSDINLPNWTPVNFQAIFSYQWGK